VGTAAVELECGHHSSDVRVGSPTALVTPGHTGAVKTAISLPDGTIERASARARALGLSRSEFFARAVGRYLDELDRSSVTAQVDSAPKVASGPEDTSTVAIAAGRELLRSGNDW